MPSDKDVFLNANAGHLFFLKNDFYLSDGLNFDDISHKNNKIIRKVSSSIISHSPTLCNFWHFGINWIYDNQEDIRNLSKSPQRSALSTIRSYLKVIADENIPSSYYLLEEHFYK
jgi:hypothetical protein